jgi:hypothetical protein
MKSHRAERIPMHALLRERLSAVSHWGAPLKGSRDKVFVVFHPPYEMATNSFLTIHGTRRASWQVGPDDADPAPEPPIRHQLAAFVSAVDENAPRVFLMPWSEYQLMLFWRIQHSSAHIRVTVPLPEVAAWEDRWDLLGAPGRDGPGGRTLPRHP